VLDFAKGDGLPSRLPARSLNGADRILPSDGILQRSAIADRGHSQCAAASPDPVCDGAPGVRSYPRSAPHCLRGSAVVLPTGSVSASSERLPNQPRGSRQTTVPGSRLTDRSAALGFCQKNVSAEDRPCFAAYAFSTTSAGLFRPHKPEVVAGYVPKSLQPRVEHRTLERSIRVRAVRRQP
jgi:hypothetical protein